MEKFKTLEEAQKAYDSLHADYGKLQSEHKTAIEIAQELNKKLDETGSGKPAKVTAAIGKQKYIVNFGVRGKSKEEVSTDQKLLAELVKIGSGALTAVK